MKNFINKILKRFGYQVVKLADCPVTIKIGTQAEQKKYIGNAVEVNMAMFMCMAMVIKTQQIESQKLKSAI